VARQPDRFFAATPQFSTTKLQAFTNAMGDIKKLELSAE
jgi:hypothetical protein